MSHIQAIPFEPNEAKQLQEHYRTHREEGKAYIRTQPGNQVLPADYAKFKGQIYNFKLRPDDIFVISWPKTGTTWTQELVWCLVNDCDFEKAKSVTLAERSPFLEYTIHQDFMAPHLRPQGTGDLIAKIDTLPMDSPRIIKSHLKFCLLPEGLLDKCKVVFCMRNPKDTVVSFFHHAQTLKTHGFEADFATWFDYFMNDQVLYSSYWDYLLEAWEKRDHPNMCLLFFEDMKKDHASSIGKVAKFLGRDLSDGTVEKLVEHLSFDKMKENKTLGPEKSKEGAAGNGGHLRKGEVGDWKNYFTDDMNKRLDEVVRQKFAGTGLEFTFEL